MASVFEGGRLPTGIDPIDRQLEGGFPAGSVVAFCAPPASQSELLLHELTAARQTLYLSTERTEEAVRDAFDRAQCPVGDPEIRYVAPDAPVQKADRFVRAVDGQANLIVDPVDALERVDRDLYRTFLNELQTHMINTGSVAVLHCLRGEELPTLRTMTEHMADVILDLRNRINGTTVETYLAVPKFRGGQALDETIKLELAERVRVDTSRDIA